MAEQDDLLQEANIFLKKRINLLLSLFFVGANFGYFFAGQWSHPFLGLWGIWTLQFLFFFLFVMRQRRGQGISLSWILAIALASRVILWFTEPVLENDFWRYLWDGRVLAHGINPYRFAPNDPALNAIGTSYRNLIGWGHFSTIYPPFAEILFAVTHWVSGDSVFSLKVMLTGFDLGIGWILLKWLTDRSQDRRWVLLYLLNPLVLKEIANSAHLDSIPVFFSMAAIYRMTKVDEKGAGWSWASLALGVGAKLYPIVLVPLFIRVDPRWKKGLGAFAVVMVAMYLPFLSAGFGVVAGTGAYAKYWIFNASIFKVISLGLTLALKNIETFLDAHWIPFFRDALKNDYPAKGFLGLFFCGAVYQRSRRLTHPRDLPSESFWVLGLLLVLSPVVNAWYLLWALPLACLLGSLPWLVFSYLIVASYSWFYSKEFAPCFRFLEYGIFFSLLIFDYLKSDRNSFSDQS